MARGLYPDIFTAQELVRARVAVNSMRRQSSQIMSRVPDHCGNNILSAFIKSVMCEINKTGINPFASVLFIS